MTVNIQVKVFCVVTPHSIMLEYQHFREPYCPHLHFTLKMEAKRFSETLAATLHSVTNQKTST
jgi:hypothetical protein